MTSCVVFVMLVFLPCSAYVGRYHIMALVILGGALLLVSFFLIKIKMCDKSFSQVATLVSITLAIFGLDASSLKADRVISKLQSPSLLTGFLRLSFVYLAAFPFNSKKKTSLCASRFSQTSPGQWSSLLGSVTMLGKVICFKNPTECI